MIRQFGGLNRLPGANEAEFEDIENMSAEQFPLLAPRKGRVTVKTFQSGEKVTGFTNKGALVWTVETETNGSKSNALYINGRKIDGVSLDEGEKQMVGMGAYVCIFPDGYYINVVDEDDKGYMGHYHEVTATNETKLHLIPCMFDGGEFDNSAASPTAPTNPTNGQVWIDTSGDVSIYNIWDESASMWEQMSTVYVKLSFSGIGKHFAQWDGVSISGITYSGQDEKLAEQIAALNMDSALIQNRGDDWISVAALLNAVTDVTGTIVIERKVPEMDFVTECKNRLWGCKYGVVGGKTVNEIYACRQGDCKNWYAYPGVSTDSYAMSLGTDGPFTGAITYLGVPVFFKEDYIHKIYGDTPATFQMVQTTTSSVGTGQGKSLCTDGEAVFYRSAVAFCIWGGSYPSSISRALGALPEETVTAGTVGNRVWFACEREGGRELLCYDSVKGIWHRESSDKVHAFVRDGHRLYMLCENAAGVYHIDAVDGKYGTVFVDDNAPAPTAETVQWYAVTASIGLSEITAKYPRKIIVRTKMAQHSYVLCEISYDGGDWRDCFELYGEGKDGTQQVTKEIVPQRCMDFRLRFRGRGDWALVSIAKTTTQGSDRP